jgi:hypothetical protein
MVWKIIPIENPGSQTVFGGNDINKYSKLLSGIDLKVEDNSDGVTINTDTTFGSEKFSILSPTTGFKYIFKGQDIIADRIISLPLMSDDGEIQLSAAGAANDWGAFMQTFRHQNIRFMNPANTFAYVMNTGAITANRNVTFPLLTSDDTLVFANATQTLTNKTLTSPTISAMTINTDSNTVKHGTTNNAGDLLVNTGTKFDRFARGAANQVPIMNATGTALSWIDSTSLGGGGGGGETITGDYLVPTTANNVITGAWYATADGVGSGLWNGMLTNTSTVSPTDLTDGSGRMGSRYTLTSDDQVAGFMTNRTHFCRLNNPELIVRYKYLGLGQIPEYRLIMGFIDNLSEDYGVDDSLQSNNAFVWYKEKGDSTIQLARNDGNDTVVDLSATVSLTGTNESVNTIRLFADSTNNRFGISLNGANATYYTSEIPASTTRLGCIVQIENEDPSTRACEFYGATFRAKVL